MAAGHIAPTALNAVRFAVAAVIVGIAALATTGLPRAAFAAPWRYLLLGGTFATYFVLMFEGLKTAAPVSAAAVFTLTPVMTAVPGYVLVRQVATPRIALGLAVGAAGALWVIFAPTGRRSWRSRIGPGEAIYAWGCAAHAVYTPLVRLLNRGEPAVVFTFGTLVAACVAVTAWGWRDIAATDWAALPPVVWVTIAYVAVVASALTFVLLQYASLRLPSSKVMAYTYLTPTWVTGLELALGHEVPPVWVLGGVGLTVAALLILLKHEGQGR